MKTLKTFSFLLLCSLFAACNTSTDVPQAVKDAFAKKFPDAGSVSWDMENTNEWEAEFQMNGMGYSANFSNDGKWKETEHKIEKKDVPKNVMSALMNVHPDAKIKASEISETKSGRIYEFEIKAHEKTMEVAVDMDGRIKKTTEESEKMDGGDDNN